MYEGRTLQSPTSSLVQAKNLVPSASGLSAEHRNKQANYFLIPRCMSSHSVLLLSSAQRISISGTIGGFRAGLYVSGLMVSNYIPTWSRPRLIYDKSLRRFAIDDLGMLDSANMV